VTWSSIPHELYATLQYSASRQYRQYAPSEWEAVAVNKQPQPRVAWPGMAGGVLPGTVPFSTASRLVEPAILSRRTSKREDWSPGKFCDRRLWETQAVQEEGTHRRRGTGGT